VLKSLTTLLTIFIIIPVLFSIAYTLDWYVYTPYLEFETNNFYITFSTKLYLHTNGTHFKWINWILFGEMLHFYNACTCDHPNPIIIKDFYVGVKNCNLTIHQLYNNYKLYAIIDAVPGNVFEIVISGLGTPPTDVQLDNYSLARVFGRDAYVNCVNCWFYDPINNLIFIKSHGSTHTLLIDYGRIITPIPVKIELTYEKYDNNVKFRITVVLDRKPRIEMSYVTKLICNGKIIQQREVYTKHQVFTVIFEETLETGTYTCYVIVDSTQSNVITFTVSELVTPRKIPKFKIDYTTLTITILVLAITILTIVLIFRRKTGKITSLSLTVKALRLLFRT